MLFKSRAFAAYRDRNFSRAASLYKSAAAKASKREGRTLRRKASRLLKLQSLLSGAKNSGAIAAYVAYNDAKRIDRQVGKKHQKFINAQLLRVGPDAAKLYMAKKNYPKAARAVTISRSVGG